MDRDLSSNEISKGSRKNYLIGGVIVLAILVGLWLFRNSLQSSVEKSKIRIAIAEIGAVENTLTATGEVQPEFEQVVTSPITAVIQQVYLGAGNNVKLGDKILELDKEFTKLNFDKQKDQLDLKRNGIVKIKLELEKSFYDLQINDSIKSFRISSLKADIENAKRLLKAGGGTREAIEQAEVNLRVAQLEKRQLENDLRIKQQTMRTDLRESEIAAAIQEKDLRELERKLQQADIVASRAGVLTWVNKNLGSKVAEGEILARLADLGSFKVMGSISDVYADQLRVGMPVLVKINETSLRGKLTNIQPAVQNSVVQFEVALEQMASPLLRPQLKVEVFIVTAFQSKTVRIANGPAFKGGQSQDIFVLTAPNKAERRHIKIGLSNFDFVEIKEGIRPGEKVILTDLNSYTHLQELEIK